jgi:hypothetical protein
MDASILGRTRARIGAFWKLCRGQELLIVRITECKVAANSFWEGNSV